MPTTYQEDAADRASNSTGGIQETLSWLAGEPRCLLTVLEGKPVALFSAAGNACFFQSDVGAVKCSMPVEMKADAEIRPSVSYYSRPLRKWVDWAVPISTEHLTEDAPFFRFLQAAASAGGFRACFATDSKAHFERKCGFGFFGPRRLRRSLANLAADMKQQAGAVDQITVRDELAKLAASTTIGSVRRAATAKLDERERGAIAATHKDRLFCEALLASLTDEGMIADVAARARDVDVRRAAIERVSSQSRLETLIGGEENEFLRNTAIGRVTDQGVLRRLWATALGPSRLTKNISAIVAQMTDQQLLTEVAMSNVDSSRRSDAIERLADRDVLEEVYRILGPADDFLRRTVERRMKALAIT